MVELDIRIDRLIATREGVMIHGVVTKVGDEAGAWREVFLPAKALDGVELSARAPVFVQALRDSWVNTFMPPEEVAPKSSFRVSAREP